jgi:hypothetical protein
MALETGLTLGERLASLFQPDTLIPEQYLQSFRRLTHLQPEKRLMLAVLEDGVACFQKYLTARDGRGKRIFRETEEWVLEEPSERLFSFANVCETLGLNPDYLRHGLMRWKAAQLEQHATARVYQLVPTPAATTDPNENSTDAESIADPMCKASGT